MADIIEVCKVPGVNNKKAEQTCGMRKTKYDNHFIMI
jgi:Holliday junction resolvasome RuvABC DNA-binding subunit